MKNQVHLWIVLFLLGSVCAQGSLPPSEAPSPDTQETELIAPQDAVPEFEEDRIIPNVEAEKYIEINRPIIFSGEGTRQMAPSNGVARYIWDFGDGRGPVTYGKQVEYIFPRAGRYDVQLKVKQGAISETMNIPVVAYNRKAVLFTDKPEVYESIIITAEELGIWLKPIIYEATAQTEFSAEEVFIQKIQENRLFIEESELLIFDTKSASALQGFSQYWQKVSPENKFNTRAKTWIDISEGSLEQKAKLVKPLFLILRPTLILLTRREALYPIFEGVDESEITTVLRGRAIEHRVVDERSRTNPLLILSFLTTQFVAQGISQNIIYLLFAVPFITFVISFFRQFVGISTFGVYAPLMLALSLMVLGFGFGMLVFLIVWCVSYVIRVIFEKVDLLYIPRVSLLFSILALSFFLILGLGVYFKVSVNMTLTIFPMLVMATISEKFISAQTEEGLRGALFATLETVFVALMAYALVTWSWLQSSVLAMPELILVPMIGTVWLGRFTGLRLSEYFKFRSLFGEDTQE